jgi:hypothetical protein
MCERRKGPWVFRTRYGLALANFSSGKAQLESKLPWPVAPWAINDLRRTVAKGLEKLGVQRHVILNQAPHGSMQQHRIVHHYEKEKREALDLWARHLEELAEKHTPEDEQRFERMRQEILATHKPTRTTEEAIPDARAVLSMLRST